MQLLLVISKLLYLTIWVIFSQNICTTAVNKFSFCHLLFIYVSIRLRTYFSCFLIFKHWDIFSTLEKYTSLSPFIQINVKQKTFR